MKLPRGDHAEVTPIPPFTDCAASFSVIFLISVKVLSSWMFFKFLQGFFPFVYFFRQPSSNQGLSIFLGTVTLKLRDCEALPTRLLEGLPICSVQPPMLHSFFNNRVVALYKYRIMITATEVLVDPPSLIQI